MTDREDRKCGRDAAGRFAAGNPGKAPGTRNRTTRAAEELLEGQAERLTAKAIMLAMSGDVVALRLCLERLLPARKCRPIEIELPEIRNAANVIEAQARVIAAMSAGAIGADEAGAIAGVLGAQLRAVEVATLEERIAALEQRLEAGR